MPACLVGDDAPRHPGKCRGGEDELLLGAGAESEEEGRVPPANPARSARLSRKRVRLSLLPSPPPGDMGSKIARSGEDAVTGRGETLTRSQRPRHPTASLRPRSPALLWPSSTIPTPFSHPLTPPPALSISRFGGSPLSGPLLPGLQEGAAAAVAPSLGFLDSPSPLNIWLRGLVFQMCLLGGQMCAFPPPMAWWPACLGGRVGGLGSFLKSRRNLSPQASGLGLPALSGTRQNEVSNPDPTPLPDSLQRFSNQQRNSALQDSPQKNLVLTMQP